MEKLTRVYEERIQSALERVIDPLIYGETTLASVSAMTVSGEPISFQEAVKRDFEPCAEGVAWGARWDTVWFRIRAVVPEDWSGRCVVAQIDLSFEENEGFGREGLVYVDGKPVIAVNRNRSAVPLIENAVGGEEVDFYIEAAANPSAKWFWGDGEKLMPDYGGEPMFKLKRARLATYDEEAFQLKMDFEACRQAMFELPESETRRGQLLRALNRCCDHLDLGDPACIPVARESLREILAKKNGDTCHRITAVGHAHIDTAWCWPLRESIRKCARSFSTALRYMDQYPDYRFVCSQPQQYAWMKEYYPEIFADILEAVKRGQWEPVGGMWVESDCNIPSGESLVRQIIHGKNYYQDVFGAEIKNLWLPDVFGYSAALPQILRRSGINYFLTQKISWSDTNQFPHHTFYWEGIDGTRVFTHFPPVDTYNCQMTAAEIKRSEHNFREKDRATRALVPFGHGDGGGGPTPEHIELARRWRDFEGIPKVEMGGVADFFEQAEVDAIDPPVWRGELYLELHRGTLTSQAYTKYMNRKCELALRDAEFFQVIASRINPGELLDDDPVADRPVWDVAAHVPEKAESTTAMALDRAWKTLLLNQFHDIIPGSSIHLVYEDCRIDYPNVMKVADEVREGAVAKLLEKIDTSGVVKPVVVFNTLAHDRAEVIQLSDSSLAYVHVPQCGYCVVDAAEDSDSDKVSAVMLSMDGDDYLLENSLVSMRVSSAGLVTFFRDLECDRDVISDGQAGNLLQLHKDYPNKWNAWDVDVFYKDQVENLTSQAEIQVLEEGPLRVVLRVSRSFGESRFSQRIVMQAGSKRVDFHCDVDWQEHDRLLKVAFPVEISSLRASYEIQYGHVERNTHDNTSWDAAMFEVPVQKWADLSESDYGVALLNDCKYAADIRENVMRLTLLKAANAPDPVADRGMHRFSYALFPHEGDLQIGRVIEEAGEFNVPLHVVATEQHQGDLPNQKSFIKVNRNGVFLEALKLAERSDAAVLRVYEGYRSRGSVRIESDIFGSSPEEVDLMEKVMDEQEMEARDEAAEFQIRPFEIRTFRYE